MFDKVKIWLGSKAKFAVTGYVTAAKAISTELVKEIIDQSDFHNKHEFEICQLLYTHEPDIGGAIDRLSTLASESYRGPILKDFKGTDIEVRCLEKAKAVSETFNFSSLIEQWTEGLLTYGNVCLLKKDLSTLPIEYLTLRPDKLPLTSEIMTFADKVYIDEGLSTEKIYNLTDVYHIKYKHTSIYLDDRQGRQTFGLYSISPLFRLFHTTWWKKQAMLIDILWRWRMVPREHHVFKTTAFDLGQYTGTAAERRAAAKRDAESTINAYISKLSEQMPDQGYVTLDTQTIDVIEPKTKFMQANELLSQLDEKVWEAINLPKSTVSGRTQGSYASELVTSSFVGIKVGSIMKKIAPVLTDILRQKVKAIDPSLPYLDLTIDYGFELKAAELERFRESSIMASLGAFTLAEVRTRAGYAAKPPEKLFKTETTKLPGTKGTGDLIRDLIRGDDLDEPETPWSEEEHKTVKGLEAEE